MSLKSPSISIVQYKSEFKIRFREINEQWITRDFDLEEEDIRTLEDPEGYIVKKGGFAFVALYNGMVVGTCAYLNFGNGVYEMIKMAVDEDYRGLKIGKALGEQTLQFMRTTDAKKIILFSNTKGSRTAIELYRKLGFVEVPLGESEFLRADIRMEMVL